MVCRWGGGVWHWCGLIHKGGALSRIGGWVRANSRLGKTVVCFAERLKTEQCTSARHCIIDIYSFRYALITFCLRSGCETWSLTLTGRHRFGVFENGVLRDLRGTRKLGTGWNCTVRSFMMFTHQILFWWSNIEELNGQGMWYVWGNDRCIQGFGEENSVNENTRKIWDWYYGVS